MGWGMQLRNVKTDCTIRKGHAGEIQVEGIQRESLFKRGLHWAGKTLGVLAIGGLPFYTCSPPPREILFEGITISGHIARDSSVTRDTGAIAEASADGSPATALIPASGNSLIPDNSIYLKEATNFVPFKFSDTGATFLIAENQLSVTFRDEASDKNISDVQRWLTEQGASKTGEIVGLKLMQYEVNAGTDFNALFNHLKEQPGVLTALPNFLIRPARNPDPNPVGTVYNGYWWIDRIRLREAWDVTTGSSQIPIAVVDDGVSLDCGHFDGKKILLGLRCKKADGRYYYSDQINSTNECEAHLPGAHGTEVASVLASRGDDGRGAIGVAWENPLISIDLWGRDGKYGTDQLNAAIECAIDMGARVINVSYTTDHQNENGEAVPGGLVTLEETTKFRAAILKALIKAHQKNVLVVLASGNSGFKNDDAWLPPDLPPSDAEYFKSNALIVGATDDWDDPLCSQNWSRSDLFCSSVIRALGRCTCPACMDVSGSYPITVEGKVVEISAPGYRIAAADAEKCNASTIRVDATSFAAPMVAGAAALVLSVHPDYTAEQVKQILLNSARPGGCRQIGHGILDVAAAVGVTNEPWNNIYSDFEEFKSIRQTSGGYVLSTGGGCIVKTNIKGSVLWSYNNTVGDRFTLGADALELADGTHILVGTATSLAIPVPFSTMKIFIAKVNSNGELLWLKLAGRTDTDWPSAVQEMRDGGLVIAGQTAMQNMYIVKTDTEGNKIWEQVLDAGSILSVESTTAGFFLSGYVGKASDKCSAVIKTDPDGVTLWKKTFAGRTGMHLSKLREGGVIVATSYAGGEILNLSEDGTVTWGVKYGGFNDFFSQVVQTRDGGFIAIGDKFLSFPTLANIWLVKLDAAGKMQWEKTFGVRGRNDGNAVLETSDGGFILAGDNNFTVHPPGEADGKFGNAWLIKTDKNGNVE